MPLSHLTLLAIVPLLAHSPDQILNTRVNQESSDIDDEVIYLGTLTKRHASKVYFSGTQPEHSLSILRTCLLVQT
jgi:hypothetical protein